MTVSKKILFAAGLFAAMLLLMLFLLLQNAHEKLKTCQATILTQNNAVESLAAAQKKTDHEKSIHDEEANKQWSVDSKRYDNLKAPEECRAAIKWGIQHAKQMQESST